MDSSFLMTKISAKFRWDDPHRGRQIPAIFYQYFDKSQKLCKIRT